MIKEFICTSCPNGCKLEVSYNKRSILQLKGNECKKGEEYARNEVFHPKRIVTTTVKINGASIPLLPVKTSQPVPKNLCIKIVKEASFKKVNAPVKAGDVIISNIFRTGVDLVATRTLK